MKKALSTRDVRISNGKFVLNRLFHNPPMLKQELADATGLSLPTLTGILKNLRGQGLVRDGEKLISEGGRPASYIQPVYDAGYAVGIQVKRDRVRIAATDLAMHLLDGVEIQLPFRTESAYWTCVAQHVEEFITRQSIPRQYLLGVGLALQGILHPTTGSLTFTVADHSIQINPSDIAPYFSSYPFTLVSESKMECYALAWGTSIIRDFIYLCLDDHVDGAIVQDGVVYRYEQPNAAFGHMVLKRNGIPCTCGRRGCMDTLCSITALETLSGLPFSEFLSRLSTEDLTCVRLVQELLLDLSQALSILHNVFHLDIVLDGELAQALRPYFPQLRNILSLKEDHQCDGSNPLQYSLPSQPDSSFLKLADPEPFRAAIGAGLGFVDRFLSSLL